MFYFERPQFSKTMRAIRVRRKRTRRMMVEIRVHLRSFRYSKRLQ